MNCSVLGLIFAVIVCTTSLERESDGAYSPLDNTAGHPSHPHSSPDVSHQHQRSHAHHSHSHPHGDNGDWEQNNVSPNEGHERLVRMAREHDTNEDGRISLDELQMWIFESFKSLNEEDSLTKFHEADADGDGFVSWAEHLKETWGMEDEEQDLKSSAFRDEIGIVGEEKLLFTAADRDQDGLLSQEEYVIFERPEQHDFMQPLVIQRAKEGKDKNNDGFVDFHEYIVDILPSYNKVGLTGDDKETLAAEKERFDEYFDLDKNGKLDDKEIFRWLIPDDNETASTEAAHIMEQADADHDSFLSFDEIVRSYNIFVGSEITDYGNALSSDNVDYDSHHDEL